MADSRDSRPGDEGRRRSRSRSPSDSAEERRRQRRKEERVGRSESPRDSRRDDDRRRDDKRLPERNTKDRRDRLKDEDSHRSSRDSSERERRHRDRGGERHISDRHGHDRRTHRDDDRHHESRHRRRHSRSPKRYSRSPRRDRHHESRPRSKSPQRIEPYKKASAPLPDQDAAFGMTSSGGGRGGRGGPSRGGGHGQEMVPHDVAEVPIVEKQVPNFAPTGVLAAATNTIEKPDGSKVVLKYHEPPEARKPSPRDAWQLFVFKGEEIIDTIPLAERSCWLIGRDVVVVDMPAEHPSISKQHAVIQFRYVEKKNEFGDRVGKVKPYLLDLESANGTFLNGDRIEESRFVEIRDKDLIKFGESTREYVVMLPPKE